MSIAHIAIIALTLTVLVYFCQRVYQVNSNA